MSSPKYKDGYDLVGDAVRRMTWSAPTGQLKTEALAEIRWVPIRPPPEGGMSGADGPKREFFEALFDWADRARSLPPREWLIPSLVPTYGRVQLQLQRCVAEHAEKLGNSWEQKRLGRPFLVNATDGIGTIEGHTAVWDSVHPTSSWTLPPEWKDRIRLGAFKRALAEHAKLGTLPPKRPPRCRLAISSLKCRRLLRRP